MLGRRGQSDRRRWKRQWFNGGVRLWADTFEVDGVGISLSRGGIYLFAIAHLPLGTQTTVQFTSPHTRKVVNITGTVRHRTVYLYGVEFDETAENRETVDASAELS
jgi:hypothetical protein